MANYRNAVGAKALKSMRMSGTTVLALTGSQTFELSAIFPDKFLIDTSIEGTQFQQVLNGDRGWRLTKQGKVPLMPGQIVGAKNSVQSLLPVKYEQSEAPRKVTGIERVGDRACYVVASHTDKQSRRLYFDVQSGLLPKVRDEISTRLGTRVEEKTFEDYRDVNGVKVPYLITTHYMEDQSVFKISEIQINIDVDPARFEPPATK
jgi:hypothetical protein